MDMELTDFSMQINLPLKKKKHKCLLNLYFFRFKINQKEREFSLKKCSNCFLIFNNSSSVKGFEKKIIFSLECYRSLGKQFQHIFHFLLTHFTDSFWKKKKKERKKREQHCCQLPGRNTTGQPDLSFHCDLDLLYRKNAVIITFKMLAVT